MATPSEQPAGLEEREPEVVIDLDERRADTGVREDDQYVPL